MDKQLDLNPEDARTQIPVDPEPEFVLEEIDGLYELIESALDTNPKSGDFVDDVRDQAIAMDEWIRKNGRATAKQLRSVMNWKSGVSAWIRE